MAEVIPISAVERLTPERDDLVSRAHAIEIVDAPSYESAGEFLKGIKALRQKIAESCDPVIAKAYETHKAALKQKREHEAPLIEAEKLLKDRIGAYHVRLDQERRAEEARLAAEAKERDEAARLEEAAALEAAGEREEAERLLSEPVIPVAPPVTAQARPRVAGVSYHMTYKAELTDLKALVGAIAAGKAPITLVKWNESAANQMARALKGEMHFDGIKVKKVPSVSASAG